MSKLTLDMCCKVVSIHDCDGEREDLEFEDGTLFSDDKFHGVTFEVARLVGSGGGWPEITLIGHEFDIRMYLEKHNFQDIDFIMEELED